MYFWVPRKHERPAPSRERALTENRAGLLSLGYQRLGLVNSRETAKVDIFRQPSFSQAGGPSAPAAPFCIGPASGHCEMNCEVTRLDCCVPWVAVGHCGLCEKLLNP